MGSMRILVIVQTARELSWALREAGRALGHGVAWYVVRFDPALREAGTDTVMPPNCQVLDIEQLDVDAERVWREIRSLEDELWREPGDDPTCQLSLVFQQAIGLLVTAIVAAEALIAAAIRRVDPTETRLPPAWNSPLGRNNARGSGMVQWLVGVLSAEQGVRCRRHWSLRAQVFVLFCLALLEQHFRIGQLVWCDAARISAWARARVGNGCRSMIRRLRGNRNKPAENGSWVGKVVLANADGDLCRQFDLKRLSPQFAQRCLVWLSEHRRLVPLLSLEFQRHDIPSLLQGSQYDRPHRSGNQARATDRIGHLVFPTLATPLVLRRAAPWFCSIVPTYGASHLSGRIRSRVGAVAMATERMYNWRALAHAGRQFAEACDLLRVLRPRVLVVGDTCDTHRAMALAGWQCGVPILATMHGVDSCHEYVVNQVMIADLHCVFGRSWGRLLPAPSLGTPPQRLVFHDALPLRKERSTSRDMGHHPQERRRILIVTSAYTCSGHGARWANSLFVRISDYATALRRLMQAFADISPRVEVTIKSHPLRDEHDLYDKIATEYAGVVNRHWREPLLPGSAIAADVAVMFNGMSSLFFTLVHEGLPVVAHWGALTPLARRLQPISELVGSADSAALARLVEEILTVPGGPLALQAHSQACSVYDTFVQAPGGGLEDAISALMERGTSASVPVSDGEPCPALTGQI